MAKCKVCKKNASKNRIITNEICNECSPKANVDNISYDEAPFDPDDTLGTTKIKDFVEWMLKMFVQCVNQSTAKELSECKKELANTKQDLVNARKELNTAKTDIKSLETKLKTLHDDHEKSKKCSQENLRYLINHDRNLRQRNVLLFGLPDEDVIPLGDESFDSDHDAVLNIFEKLELPEEVEITELFRLGKKNHENDEATGEARRSRPVKVCLGSSSMAKSLLKNSFKLKEVFNNDCKVYIKPDKSKAEREEYTRLGKRKKELLERHPTVAENDPPRVVLKNGSLLVDNVQVDHYKTPQTLF